MNRERAIQRETFRYVDVVRTKKGKLRTWQSHDKRAKEQAELDHAAVSGRHARLEVT